jgi:hypothetical protein
MIVVRHAALRAQEQQIVWQQIIIETKEYVSRPAKVKSTVNAKNKSITTKKQISVYCGFFVAVAGLDAVAGALVSSVADWMVSSLGHPLSI